MEQGRRGNGEQVNRGGQSDSRSEVLVVCLSSLQRDAERGAPARRDGAAGAARASLQGRKKDLTILQITP